MFARTPRATSDAEDVLFVCGVYKSGTSLAVHMLEQAGFMNPSRCNNRDERAFGRSLPRYHTNECREVRRLNEKVLPMHALAQWSSRRARPRACGRVELDVCEYISSLPEATVLKDPRFVVLLPLWLRACARIGRRGTVVFVERERSELEDAWRVAPLMGSLVDRPVLTSLLHEQRARTLECVATGIPVCRMTLAIMLARGLHIRFRSGER